METLVCELILRNDFSFLGYLILPILIYQFFCASDNTTIYKLRLLVFRYLLDTTKNIQMSFLFKAFDVVS